MRASDDQQTAIRPAPPQPAIRLARRLPSPSPSASAEAQPGNSDFRTRSTGDARYHCHGCMALMWPSATAIWMLERWTQAEDKTMKLPDLPLPPCMIVAVLLAAALSCPPASPNAPERPSTSPPCRPGSAVSRRRPALRRLKLPRDLSPWGMFMAADIVVKAVMVGLAFASVLTWTIWFAKVIELIAARRSDCAPQSQHSTRHVTGARRPRGCRRRRDGVAVADRRRRHRVAAVGRRAGARRREGAHRLRGWSGSKPPPADA